MPSVIAKVRREMGGIVAISLLMGCGFNPSDGDSAAPPAESAPTPELSDAAAPPPAATTAPTASPDRSAVAPVAQPLTVKAASTPLTPDALWEQLQQPGDTLYVVLLRHAIAPGTGDPATFQLDDCSTQRNLSAAGRAQATQMGQAFRDRGVAVQKVLSSQWCRCLETADLLDLGTVEPAPALNSFFRDRRTAAAQTSEVQQYLLSQADHPGVIVMVTHQVNITGLTDIFPRSGEAVVLKVEDPQITQIGQLMPAS